ncbi:Acetyltransferase (GNAT) family protein [Maioricimonas rarisocia]|uniref:Acetyltransferase (GNAT) family protein n=1 Tax=Maioricimonas rarisocia TaxID=2528026 RepID=A0A517Z0T8_9PLAN|nr:GNAT family N-acetyltransferase [Maioricimonas rarisocia]QDU36075.1 Acetyltransferase (GNAT) family protein [Maioricimonas rarisocia]
MKNVIAAEMNTASIDLGFDIVEEPLEVGIEAAVYALNETRRHSIHRARLDWLYRDNPDGPATIWVAYEGGTRNIAGMAAVLPRRLLVDRTEVRCWNCSDLSVLEAYRRRGIASALRKQARRAIENGRADLLYGHPNDRAANAHARAGHWSVGTMRRLAKVTCSQPIFEERLPRFAARPAAWVADVLLRIADRRIVPSDSYRMLHQSEAHFDERFDQLFAGQSHHYPVVGVRDAAYLNWRYGTNPLYRSQTVLAYRDDELAGFLIYTIRDGTAHIKDIFPGHDAHLAGSLLSEMVQEARRTGLRSLSFTALEQNPVLAECRRLGFRPRLETSRMFAFVPDDSPLREVVLDEDAWYVTVGDRDV